MKKGKFRWPGLLAVLASIIGIATDPAVVVAIDAAWPAMPHVVSAGLTLAGVIVAAASKPVVRTDEERKGYR